MVTRRGCRPCFRRTSAVARWISAIEATFAPEGRKLFEQFLRKVNTLQAKQLAAKEAKEDGPGRQDRISQQKMLSDMPRVMLALGGPYVPP